MPGGAEVPLDATGEPRVAQPQVGRLQHLVAVQQLAPARPVHERPQPGAVVEQERGPQGLVLEHRNGVLGRLATTRVAVLHRVREQGVEMAVGHVGPHRRVCFRHIHVLVHVVRADQRRQRVHRPERRGRQSQRVKTQPAHNC